MQIQKILQIKGTKMAQKVQNDFEIYVIKRAYEISQDYSKENKGKSFICPVCKIKRIAKSPQDKAGWNHTGCKCTYNYLEINGKTE